MKKLLLAIIFITVVSYLQAQKPPKKFGDIDISELEMKVYEKDTTAEAVVLFDFGHTYYEYSEKKDRFQRIHEEHCRIKILNKNGYKWADISFPFNDKWDKITNLKGFTYNLENGKIVKDKLERDAQFVDEVINDYSKFKFTMPNIKEGAVIEFQITIRSGMLDISDWQFQQKIPVVWSEFYAEIPEFYRFSKTFKGYEQLYLNEQKSVTDRLNYRSYKEGSNIPGFTQHYVGQETVDFEKSCERFVMKDIPAFEEEAYMTAVENYMAAITFQLASIKYPRGRLTNYTKTWESVNKVMLESDRFGGQINGELLLGGSAFLNDEVERIKSNFTAPKDRMSAAFDFVKGHMKWNDFTRSSVNHSLRKAFDEKAGNSCDINLMLVLLLKKLDIDVVPVALSTRKNGLIHPANPSFDNLNYVVALAFVNGESYFLDATSPLHPVNMLPFRCLNGNGRIVDELRSNWVELYTKMPSIVISMSDLQISEDGTLKGTIQSSKRNYAALNFRKSLMEATNEDKFIEELEEKNPGLKIQEHQFENLKEIEKPVNEKYNVEIKEQAMVMGDLIYFSPMLYDRIPENPFKLEERKYPVDYGHEINESYVNKFTIPDGYEIEEKPESIAFAMEGNTARYMYNVSQIGNVIQVMSKFSINKTMFLPEEYQTLKMFYDQVITKQAEQIVLKKKTD